MKTAISIPDDLFHQAENQAEQLGVSRSELYARAIRDYLTRHSEAAITERLNEIYSDDATGAPDPLQARLQQDFLSAREW